MKDYIYDEDSKTIWIPCDLKDALVPTSVTSHWGEVLKDGEMEDGREVRAVNFIFTDEENADYNHSALQFLNFGTYIGTPKSARPLTGGPEFKTKEDFGI